MRLTLALTSAFLVAALTLPANAQEPVQPVRGVVKGTGQAAAGLGVGTAQVAKGAGVGVAKAGVGVAKGTATAARGTGRGLRCIFTLGTRCGP
jgi:hypothetical protein